MQAIICISYDNNVPTKAVAWIRKHNDRLVQVWLGKIRQHFRQIMQTTE